MKRLAWLALASAVVTALSFFAVPGTLMRAILVTAFSAISGLSAVGLAAILAFGFVRGTRRRTWALGLAAVLVLEAVLVGGLNAYADSRSASVAAQVQDYHAEVAAAVSQGDAIAAGHPPIGVTFATVRTRALNAYLGLRALDAPAGLVDYVSSVKAWAAGVVNAASLPKGASAWPLNSVAPTPSPFQLTISVDQADTAFASSLQQVSGLIDTGDRALAAKDVPAMRSVGARLESQAYWLQGLYTSIDPNWVAAQFHFIDPVKSYPPALAVAEPDMRLVASSTAAARPWPGIRHPSSCVSKSQIYYSATVRFPWGERKVNFLCAPSPITFLGAMGPAALHWSERCASAKAVDCTIDSNPPTGWPGAEQQLRKIIKELQVLDPQDRSFQKNLDSVIAQLGDLLKGSLPAPVNPPPEGPPAVSPVAPGLDLEYLHHNCHGDRTCDYLTVTGGGAGGGDVGAIVETAQTCEGFAATFRSTGGTWWCSTSSNPADTAP